MRTVIRRPANHPMHLILSAVTCGVWLPVWAVCAIVGRRETVTVPDSLEEFQGPWSYISPNHYQAQAPVPPPWTGGSVYTTYDGRRWHWNPWRMEWEVIP